MVGTGWPVLKVAVRVSSGGGTMNKETNSDLLRWSLERLPCRHIGARPTTAARCHARSHSRAVPLPAPTGRHWSHMTVATTTANFFNLRSDELTPRRFLVASDDTGRNGWMYHPVVETVVEGVRALSGSGWTVDAHRCRGRCQNETFDQLRNGDIFCWVGVAHLFGYCKPDEIAASRCNVVPWRAFFARGVHTIYYQTEPLRATCKGACWGPFLSPLAALPWRGQLAEIWDYSLLNIERVRAQYARHNLTPPVLRHMPPGHLQSLSHDFHVASLWHRLANDAGDNVSFVGALKGERQHCMERLAVIRGHAWITPMLPCWSQHEFVRGLLQTRLTFLNLHQSCSVREHLWWEVQPCESFRFATLLSVGAAIVSQRCGAPDEAQYDGLVTFASYPEGIEASAARVARQRPVQPAALAATFAERFSPRLLCERAGVAHLLTRSTRTRDGARPPRRTGYG